MNLMKFLAVFLFLLTTFTLSAQMREEFTLPESWTKDFTISLSYHSSMSGSKTEIRFSHDSCTVNRTSRSGKPVAKLYKLKEKDRVAILKKLHELRPDKITIKDGRVAVRDGWSQSICFNTNCIEGGTSVEMDEANKNVFLETYRYLEEFADKKAR